MKTESNPKIRRLRLATGSSASRPSADPGSAATMQSRETGSRETGPRFSSEDAPPPPEALGTEAREEDGFSAAFYVGFYNDLRDKNDKEAEIHWHTLGKFEGRYGCAEKLIDDFAAKAIHLPSDFDASLYRLLLHRSVRRRIKTEVDAAAHYIAIGRVAGLRYRPEDPDFFRALYFDDRSPYSRILLAAVRRDEADIDQSAAALFARVGVRSTQFLTLFDVSDYICINAGLGLANRVHCLHHFAEHGLRKIAAISLDCRFDPDFYRATNRELTTLSDEEAYRHWLGIGLDRGESPNASRFLHKLGLLETGQYPPGFDPAIYLTANPDLADRVVGEWRLLQHCINNGIVEKRPGCQPSRQNVDLFRAAADLQAVEGKLEAAQSIYRDVLARDPRHVLGLRHYSDCLLRLGDWFNAALLYQETIRYGLATVWTYLNLATCCVNLKRWDEAAAALRTIQLRHSGDLGIRNRLREVCRTGFESMRDEAVWLADNGFDERARSRMHEAVELLAIQTAGAPAALAKADRDIGTIAIIADTGLPQCRFYRVDQKLAQLNLLGIECQLFDFREKLDAFHQRLPALQAVIFYRVPATPEIVDAIEAVRRAHIPSFYEIDDLMFETQHFPEGFDSYGGQISRPLYGSLVTGTETLRGAMALCDYALASTGSLAERMAPVVRSGQAFVHRNALHAPHEKMMAAARARRDDGHINIFYGTGTKAHNADFEQHLTPALARILAEFPLVRMVIVGYLVLPPALACYADQIMLVPPVWEIEAYWRVLAGMDISLAVLKPGAVADCKSEIKWLEAGMLGIPSIVTPTQTYRDAVADGETGLFATTPGGLVQGDAASDRQPDRAAEDRRRRAGCGARRLFHAGHGAQPARDPQQRDRAAREPLRREAHSGGERLLSTAGGGRRDPCRLGQCPRPPAALWR